jgi:hypothetical protein
MPKPFLPSSQCRPPFVSAGVGVGVAASLLVGLPAAHAEFAPPPESPYGAREPRRQEPPLDPSGTGVEPWEPPAAEKPSTFRFHVGPAVLLRPAGPGLFTAVDIGERAVGARLSAVLLRAESAEGLAGYAGELWIDLRHRDRLPPIVGAGASLLHGGALGQPQSVGAGVLRAALEYELPISEADARLGLNLVAWVPAVGTERTRPWGVAALTVGAGF